MACADDIRGVFGPDNGWPAKDMTLADNLSDLNRHEREFLAREAFAYSIFERSRARRYVGCVYIKPIKSRVEDDRRKALFNAQAFCWFSPVVTDREFATLAADEFVQWVKTSWPFTKVAFPGQTIGWNEWYALACEQDRSPRMLNMYKTGFGPIAVTHSRNSPSVLAPQPERQYLPSFAAVGRRKAQAALHSCGQKRESLLRPVGYHACPLRSSSL